jgi:hypothetical protein
MGMFKTTPPPGFVPATKQEKAYQKEMKQQDKTDQKEMERFLATPVGQARTAAERGDSIFQCSIQVTQQHATIIAMVGSSVSASTRDPNVVLNAIAAEGWKLVNASFVFIEQGQQSRDKTLSSGQNVAIKGSVVGYYLFKSNERAHA